jgi:hypothetical protein
VLRAGRHDQQRVDQSPQQAQGQLALARRVLLARSGDEDVAARVGSVLDGARDRRVEGVGDVLDDEPQGSGAAPPQAAGEVVAGEAEATDGRVHARCRVGAHAALAVHHARHRLDAHTRGAGDVSHGWPGHVCSRLVAL